MPGGDGTGPAGMGPMTGRAAGFCAGYAVPGYMNALAGRGFWGGGRGRGRGWRNWYYATGLTGWQRPGMGVVPPAYAPVAPSRDQELQMLRAQAESIGNTLGDIQKRIAELEAAGDND